MYLKIREWGVRYIPSEIIAIITALVGGSLGIFLTGSNVVAAFSGTWGDNFGYYGSIFYRDMKATRRKLRGRKQTYGVNYFIKIIRNLIIEFGPAETLDSFVVRPFWMYILPIWLGNFAVGIIAGKFAADLTFYLPTIISYEFRKKYLKY